MAAVRYGMDHIATTRLDVYFITTPEGDVEMRGGREGGAHELAGRVWLERGIDKQTRYRGTEGTDGNGISPW